MIGKKNIKQVEILLSRMRKTLLRVPEAYLRLKKVNVMYTPY